MTRVPYAARGDLTQVRRYQLTPARRRLLDLLDQVWFGRLEDLMVRGGEPAFDRPPRAVATVKIVGKVDPRPSRVPTPDDPVSEERLALFAHLDRLGDGLVRRLEVGHANPLFIEIATDPAPAA